MWSSITEAFSGAVIELMHGQFDIVFGDEFEGHFLWKKLANQSVHVLVGTALPRGIRMGKEEVRIKLVCDTLVLGELPTVVSREGMNAREFKFEVQLYE